MDVTNYSLKPGIHSGKPVIWIQFPNDKKLIAALKQRFPSAKWSRSQRGWYLPDFPTIRALLNMKPKDVYMKSFQKIHPINIKAMESIIHHYSAQIETSANTKTP